MLVALGVLLVGVGGLLWKRGDWGILGRLGRLPGDLSWGQGNWSVHVPLTTCLLVSVLLSLLGWWLRR
ncbi:MAG: hypothetical protein RLZZ244_1515 [Verrucomicrobiota bacterium]